MGKTFRKLEKKDKKRLIQQYRKLKDSRKHTRSVSVISSQPSQEKEDNENYEGY